MFDFHTTADAILDKLSLYFEELGWDADLVGEVLTAPLPQGGTYLINKHGPSRQVWVASPLTGAHHFTYNLQTQMWEDTRTGQDIEAMIQDEIKSHVA